MSDNPVPVWEAVLALLEKEVPRASFETWFAKLSPISLDHHSLAVTVPDAFTKGGLERRYRAVLDRAASSVCGHEIHVDLRVDGPRPEKGTAPSLKQDDERLARSRGETLPLNPDYTFERFVRGKSNHLAYAASMAVAEAPGKAYNPLFIYGGVGLGKTHLLQAIGNFLVHERSPGAVVYTTSERFAIEMINSIRSNTTGSFREKYRRIDLLLIDDVHFLEGKEATQEELFHTFNELYGSEKQIVLSSDRSPEQLSGLQERLVSRFRWGLVADIQPPDLETRIAILREKASNRGLQVEDAILELIATRISSNVRALEGALVRAMAYAELQGTPLTSRNLEEILPEEGRRDPLSIAAIKDEVASRYHLKRLDLEGTSRRKEITQARHIAIYLARELTAHSFPAIGKQFGNRDHTTVIHAYLKVKALIEEAPLLHSEVKEIQESLGARFRVPR